MDDALVELVWERARGRCEYCCLAQVLSEFGFEIDHIIARKHGGRTVGSNLALTCFFCNSYKGPNIAGLDPRSKRLVGLFHPRRNKWPRHFRWDGPVLVGRTAKGRATVAVLRINHPEFIEARQSLIAENLFPPE